MTPYYDEDGITIYHGEALTVLGELSDSTCQAVITDPPYSSGGAFRGDRTQGTRNKYHADSRYNEEPDFSGDNRDQRGYGYWSALWLGRCLQVVQPGGVACVFTDWRQLPTTTDAIQAGGWVWRGIVPWHKPSSRPISGRFNAACEYVVWGSSGARSVDGWGFALPGFYQANAPRDRQHLTQKPLEVLKGLVQIVAADEVILDPFMGSGTTLVAAKSTNRRAIGIEIEERYCEVAASRLAQGVLAI